MPSVVISGGEYAENVPNLLLTESQFKMRLYDEDLLTMENDGTVSLNLLAGSDLYLRGDDSDPSILYLIGGSYYTTISCDSDGYDFEILPGVTETIDAYIGSSSKIFNSINMYTTTYKFENSTGFIGISGADIEPAPTDTFNLGTTDLRFNDLYCCAANFKGNVVPDATSSRLFGGPGAYWATSYINTGIFSTVVKASSHKGADLGTATTAAFDDAYADDFNNVADIPFLDDRDDLKFLMNLKGSGVYDERTGLEIIDDNTLPDFVKTMDKSGNKEILLDPDGKPYFTVKAMLGWLSGCIRQLNQKYEDHIGAYHG